MTDAFGGEGQFDLTPFTDEYLDAQPEIENTEDADEGQGTTGRTQDEPNDIEDTEDNPTDDGSPDDEQTSEADSEEAGTDEPQDDGQVQQPAEDYQQLIEKINQLEQNYANVRSWASRTSNEKAELERRLAQYEQVSSNQQVQSEPEDDLEALVGNTRGYIQSVVKEIMGPILEEREMSRRNAEFSRSYKECAEAWSQLNTEQGQNAVVAKMTELSIMDGDEKAWQKDPSRYIFKASKALWGIPKMTDKAAIEAAQKAGREQLRRELESQNKNGRSVTPNANQQIKNKRDSSEEDDEIRNEIARARSKSIWL